MFSGGRRAALARYGIAPPDEEPRSETVSLTDQLLPLAAGLASAGAVAHGVYNHFRTPVMTGNPHLDAIRREAHRGGYHPLVDVTRRKIKGDAKKGPFIDSAWEYINNSLQPQVGKDKKLDAFNRLKMWTQYGPGAIGVGTGKRGRSFRINSEGNPTRKTLHVDGVVGDRHEDITAPEGISLPQGEHIRGGIDLEGSPRTMQLASRLGHDKVEEARFLTQHVPDLFPRTSTNVRSFFPENTTGLNEKELVHAIKKNIKRAFPQGFLVKPATGLKSSGAFPSEETNWGKEITKYREHFNDPKNVKAFSKLNDLPRVMYLHKHDLHQADVIDQLLRNPEGTLVQEKIPNFGGEYRVHHIAGAPVLSMVRHAGRPQKIEVPEHELLDFTGGAVARFPKEYQGAHYGFDVAVGRDANGKIIKKIIETNPYDLRIPGVNPGGGAGTVAPEVIPGTGIDMYEHVTGTKHPLTAGIYAGAAAIPAGLAGFYYGNRLKNKMNDEDDPRRPPWPS